MSRLWFECDACTHDYIILAVHLVYCQGKNYYDGLQGRDNQYTRKNVSHISFVSWKWTYSIHDKILLKTIESLTAIECHCKWTN